MHSRAIAWAMRKTPELCPGRKHEGKGDKSIQEVGRDGKGVIFYGVAGLAVTLCLPL